MDITFEIFDPAGKRVISDVRQEDGLHNLESGKGGDFQFCFDNRFSRMASKVSFFSILKIFVNLNFRPFSGRCFLMMQTMMIMTTRTTIWTQKRTLKGIQ